MITFKFNVDIWAWLRFNDEAQIAFRTAEYSEIKTIGHDLYKVVPNYEDWNDELGISISKIKMIDILLSIRTVSFHKIDFRWGNTWFLLYIVPLGHDSRV